MADKIKVDIVAGYDDKEAKAAIKDAEKIEGLDPELTITTEDKASTTLKEVTELVEVLGKADATVVLQAKVDVAQADLKAVQTQLADIEATTTEVDIDTSKAQQGLEKVRDTGDQTGSVLANMVGNTTQDLAGLGGVAGTVGGALGQIGEYATEGNISLANLGKLAGPMAGVAVAGLAISTVVGRMQQNAKDAKEEFEALVKVQKDLAAGEIRAAAKGLSEQYADLAEKAAGFGLEVVDVADAIVGSGSAIDDLDGRIARLSVQYEEANTKATMYADGGAEQLAGKLYDQITALQEVKGALENARGAYGNADTDAIDAATSQAAFEEALRKVGPTATDAGRNIRDFSADTLEAKDAAKEAAEKVAAFDAKVRLLLGSLNAEQAWLNLKENIDRYTTDMYVAGTGTDAHREAVINLQEEMITYVGQLESLPEEKKTEIIADIMDEDWQEAENKLALLAPTEGRPARINPFVDANAEFQTADQLERLAAPRTVVFTPAMAKAYRGAAGIGGVPTTAAPAPAAAPMNVTINMPRGARGVDVVRQVSGQARRSGRRYGTPVVHYARR